MKTIIFIFFIFLDGSCLHVQGLTVVKNDKATIVFYRPSLWGAAFGYKLKLKDSCLTRIKYGSYYVLQLLPGSYRFQTRTIGTTNLDLSVEGGHTYLVKCGVKFGIPIPVPKLKVLSKQWSK